MHSQQSARAKGGPPASNKGKKKPSQGWAAGTGKPKTKNVKVNQAKIEEQYQRFMAKRGVKNTPMPKEPPFFLFVGNLPANLTVAQLKRIFLISSAQTDNNWRVHLKKVIKNNKPVAAYAFIQLPDQATMQELVAHFNGYIIRNRKILVEIGVQKQIAKIMEDSIAEPEERESDYYEAQDEEIDNETDEETDDETEESQSSFNETEQKSEIIESKEEQEEMPAVPLVTVLFLDGTIVKREYNSTSTIGQFVQQNQHLFSGKYLYMEGDQIVYSDAMSYHEFANEAVIAIDQNTKYESALLMLISRFISRHSTTIFPEILAFAALAIMLTESLVEQTDENDDETYESKRILSKYLFEPRHLADFAQINPKANSFFSRYSSLSYQQINQDLQQLKVELSRKPNLELKQAAQKFIAQAAATEPDLAEAEEFFQVIEKREFSGIPWIQQLTRLRQALSGFAGSSKPGPIVKSLFSSNPRSSVVRVLEVLPPIEPKEPIVELVCEELPQEEILITEESKSEHLISGILSDLFQADVKELPNVTKTKVTPEIVHVMCDPVSIVKRLPITQPIIKESLETRAKMKQDNFNRRMQRINPDYCRQVEERKQKIMKIAQKVTVSSIPSANPSARPSDLSVLCIRSVNKFTVTLEADYYSYSPQQLAELKEIVIRANCDSLGLSREHVDVRISAGSLILENIITEQAPHHMHYELYDKLTHQDYIRTIERQTRKRARGAPAIDSKCQIVCPICWDPYDTVADGLFCISRAPHWSCVKCLHQYCNIQMENNNPSLTCSMPGCQGMYLNTHLISKVSVRDPNIAEKYTTAETIMFRMLVGEDAILECSNCGYITEKADNMRQWRCGEQVPDSIKQNNRCCGTVWCLQCQPIRLLDNNHGRCVQANVLMRVKIENTITTAFTNICPKYALGTCSSSVSIVKEIACNHMTCRQCQANFCNLCGVSLDLLTSSSKFSVPNHPCEQFTTPEQEEEVSISII